MGISKEDIKKYLRVNHALDDDFIVELIEEAKTTIKEKTGVEYSHIDYPYNKAIRLYVHHNYFNRGETSEKQVYSIPNSFEDALIHLGVRGSNTVEGTTT